MIRARSENIKQDIIDDVSLSIIEDMDDTIVEILDDQIGRYNLGQDDYIDSIREEILGGPKDLLNPKYYERNPREFFKRLAYEEIDRNILIVGLGLDFQECSADINSEPIITISSATTTANNEENFD